MSVQICEDNLFGPEVAELLREHLQSAALHSPAESVHTLDIDSLKAPDITFWTARDGSDLLGCGALKELDSRHGEIKSMRVVHAHLRKGIGSRILKRIITESKRRSYSRLSLETGSMDAFSPARALYMRFGFENCAPFGDYREDPFSLFMTLAL